MNSPGDFTTSPFLPTTGEIQTIGIAISPRKEGALPVTTRGMDKGIPGTRGHQTGASCCSKMLAAAGQNHCRERSVRFSDSGQFKVAAYTLGVGTGESPRVPLVDPAVVEAVPVI
jgi:hypothetical protein